MLRVASCLLERHHCCCGVFVVVVCWLWFVVVVCLLVFAAFLFYFLVCVCVVCWLSFGNVVVSWVLFVSCVGRRLVLSLFAVSCFGCLMFVDGVVVAFCVLLVVCCLLAVHRCCRCVFLSLCAVRCL